MKNLFFLGTIAVLLLGTAACSSDIEPTINGDEANVTFTVNLGDNIDSRTISDGTGADILNFAVFDQNGNEITALAQRGIEKDYNGDRFLVYTHLVKGRTYQFVFWAQNSACTAYNTTNMKAITVDYSNANCNDETRDAFYKTLTLTVGDEGVEWETVTLTRPFSQINFVTSDAAGVVDVNNYLSKVTVTGVPNTLNTLDGSVTGSTSVTFDYATFPNETLAGYEDYKYVAMNYLLAGTDKELKETVALTVNDGTADVNTVTVSNCPVQRNYRTNIFGNLITMSGQFNIDVDPMYQIPDINVFYNTAVISGVFSVASDKKIQFGAGNVQYHTGTHAWRFAANQYDVVGEEDNIRLGDPTLSAWVDLFAWSCESVPYGVSPSNKDSDYTGDFMDWGDLFADDWYTLSKDEFQYLLTGRSNAVNLRAEGTVAGQNGLILLPDNWTLPAGLTFVPGYVGLAGWNGVTDENADVDEYTENIYTAEQWSIMEAAGAVFLPHAGSRTGGYGNMWNGANQAASTNPETGYYSWVDNVQYYGYYWSSTVHPTNSNLAYYLITPSMDGALENYLGPAVWSRELRRGNSVRLVKPVQSINGGGEGMTEGEEN